VSEIDGRRPISARKSGWAQAIARRLASSSITPNQISIASIAFAAMAGAAFFFAGASNGAARIGLLIAGALGCQARLLCNLFDGMVAVEGGKATKDGSFWNEVPDRIADIVILVGAGYGVAAAGFIDADLGWAAATFAVLTAYVRELGRASGAPADYSGPMAKPHRMAAITAGAGLALFEPLWGWSGHSLALALAIVAIGSAFTAVRRAARLVRALRAS
jgi:phosphatidylglycerophosphate synthase